MKRIYNYIISIVLLFPLGIQAKSVREYMQNAQGVQLVDNGTLDLSRCGLTSLDGLEDIPHPEAIQSIYLNFNELETIPACMFDRFINLERIDLSDNYLYELPAQVFNALTQLIDIDLHSNQLSELNANIFQNQTLLVRLDLSCNNLCTLPTGIFNTTNNLQYLYLQHNMLKELPDAIFNKLARVQTIDLSGNQLNVLRADTFKDTTNLVVLDLSENHLRTLPANIFGTTRNLRAISLHDNKLHMVPQGVFAGLKRLGSLYIDDNYLPGTEEEFKQYYLGNRQLDYFEFKSKEQWGKELLQRNMLALLNNPELNQDKINELTQELKQSVEYREQEEQHPRMAILRDHNGNTVLHRAIVLRNQDLVSELVRLWPHLLKVKNNGGRTPLHVAAGLPSQTKEDREIAYQLFAQILARGRQHRERLLTVKDNDGNTPIQLALKNKQNLIFEKLLSLIPMQIAQQKQQ